MSNDPIRPNDRRSEGEMVRAGREGLMRRAGVIPSARPTTSPRPIPVYARASLGAILERVMEHSGTHQAEVARRMGLRPQSLNQYVKGTKANPSVDWLLHFLQVNGAALTIVFPTNHLPETVRQAAELYPTPAAEPLPHVPARDPEWAAQLTAEALSQPESQAEAQADGG